MRIYIHSMLLIDLLLKSCTLLLLLQLPTHETRRSRNHGQYENAGTHRPFTEPKTNASQSMSIHSGPPSILVVIASPKRHTDQWPCEGNRRQNDTQALSQNRREIHETGRPGVRFRSIQSDGIRRSRGNAAECVLQ